MSNDMASPEPIDELRAEMAALRAEFASLRDEHRVALDELAARRASTIDAPEARAPAAVPQAELQVTSRRRMLALAGGAAAAAVAVATATSSTPAAADNNNPILIANNTNASSGKIISTFVSYALSTSNVDSKNMFVVGDDGAAFNPAKPAAISGYAGRLLDVGVSGISARSSGNGVFGWATHPTSAAAYGVYGVSNEGPAIVGDSAGGLDFYARGTGRVLLKSVSGTPGPPTTGTYSKGELVRDISADYYVCSASGTPGTWRKLGGATTAGALHVINPARVYDSRLPGAGGLIANAQDRIVSVANAIDVTTGAVVTNNVVPFGATAIAYNITIANATTQGFLAVTPGDAGTFGASTINWTPGTPTLANGTLVQLDANRQVRVFAGGGGSTDFIIDVTGYYI